jgi:DUF1365 family protein
VSWPAAGSALARGTVLHRRAAPPAHAFRYGVFMTLLDLDELPSLDRRLRLFGSERARPLSFRASDHLDGRGDPRAALARVVQSEGRELPGGQVRLLTNCRVLGYVFNPVSFWYCHDEAGRLALVVAEVNNTYGDRHCYTLPVERGAQGGEWRRKKLMHVSPFTRPDAGTYRFRLQAPTERAFVSIDLEQAGETVVKTRLSLALEPLTDAAIASAFVRHPLMTATVIGAIHVEALRLWWKGARFWSRPPYDPAAAAGGPA